MADKMLETGFARLSPYGRFDAIYKENNASSEWHKEKLKQYPVLYNNEVFFFDNAQNRDLFISNPLKFMNIETKVLSLPLKTPIKIAIVGPPKSGRTTLADRFASEQNLLKISLGEACRRMLAFYPNSHLSKKINGLLITGETISCELQIEAVEHWLLAEKARSQGYVFDGFPCTEKQITLLNESGIIPLSMIELYCDEEEALKRAAKAKLSRTEEAMRDQDYHEAILHDSPKIIAYKDAYFRNNISQIRKYYLNRHQNWHTFNAKQNRWKLWEEVKSVVITTLDNVQKFVQNSKLDKAASVKHLAITPEDLTQNLSKKFNHLCPVALKDDQATRDSIDKFSYEFTAKYLNEYFRMADQKNLEKFLQKPDFYVNQSLEKIPTEKVVVHSEEDGPISNPCFGKFCPVTRVLTGELKYGQPNIGASYKEQNYIFADKNMRQHFIRQPERYCESNNKLPLKIPPIPEIGESITPLKDLPALGYLEQTCSKAVSSAFCSLRQSMPKIPWLSVEESALLYTATHLKAYNPQGTADSKHKYRQQLEKIKGQSDLLGYLAETMTRRYREPEQRAEGFDEKISEFYRLRR